MGLTVTLVNIFCEERRALVAVDTAVGGSKGKLVGAQASKLWVLPHGGLLIVGRGALLFFGAIALRLAGATDPPIGLSFDEAPHFLPETIRDAWTARQMTVRAPTDEGEPERDTLYIVGWSESRQRMAALAIEVCDGKIKGKPKRVERVIAPDFGTETAAAPIETHGQMLEVARRQVFSRPGDAVIGGSLHVAELTMTDGQFCAAVRDMGPIE